MRSSSFPWAISEETKQRRRLAVFGTVDSGVLLQEAKNALLAQKWSLGRQLADVVLQREPGHGFARWLREAAENKMPREQMSVTEEETDPYLLYMASFATRERRNDIRLLEKAAENSHFVPAMVELGVRIACGQGTEPSSARAETWFRKAYELGDVSAAFELGSLYADRDNDMQRAKELFSEASKGNHLGAIARLYMIKKCDEEDGFHAECMLLMGRICCLFEALDMYTRTKLSVFCQNIRDYAAQNKANPAIRFKAAEILVDLFELGASVDKHFKEGRENDEITWYLKRVERYRKGALYWLLASRKTEPSVPRDLALIMARLMYDARKTSFEDECGWSPLAADSRELLSRTPILLQDAVCHWPACTKWDFAYFSENFGHADVRCWKQSMRGALGTPVSMPMAKFIHQLRLQEAGSDDDLYCGNGRIDQIDPRLLKDIDRPFPQLGGDCGNLWMGRALHLSHLHYDAHPGMLCGIKGTKTVELWPPQAISASASARTLNVYTGNLSELPASAMKVALAPGDALIIPPYWWHLVLSDTDTISVNFWYYPLEEIVQRKFGEYWPIVRSEVERILELSGKKWELMSERELRQIFVATLQGGHVEDHVYEQFKPQIVDVVQRFLSK